MAAAPERWCSPGDEGAEASRRRPVRPPRSHDSRPAFEGAWPRFSCSRRSVANIREAPSRPSRLRESPVCEPLYPPLASAPRRVPALPTECVRRAFRSASRAHGSRCVPERGTGAVSSSAEGARVVFLPEKKISGQNHYGLRWFASRWRSGGCISPGRHCSKADRLPRSCVNHSVFGQKLETSRQSRRAVPTCRAR